MRQDAVEAAWAVVEPVIKNPHPVRAYRRGSWGPLKADVLTAAQGGWHNPTEVINPGKRRKGGSAS